MAPATGCDLKALGREAKIPYTAVYVFYQAKDTATAPKDQKESDDY